MIGSRLPAYLNPVEDPVERETCERLHARTILTDIFLNSLQKKD